MGPRPHGKILEQSGEFLPWAILKFLGNYRLQQVDFVKEKFGKFLRWAILIPLKLPTCNKV